MKYDELHTKDQEIRVTYTCPYCASNKLTFVNDFINGRLCVDVRCRGCDGIFYTFPKSKWLHLDSTPQPENNHTGEEEDVHIKDVVALYGVERKDNK